MCHPHWVGGKSKDRKKKSTQSARQAAQRRAVQQRTAERRVRDLRFRLLSARDASAAADRLMDELWLAGRGIPRDERASYQAVVEELWAGKPPQVTETLEISCCTSRPASENWAEVPVSGL